MNSKLLLIVPDHSHISTLSRVHEMMLTRPNSDSSLKLFVLFPSGELCNFLMQMHFVVFQYSLHLSARVYEYICQYDCVFLFLHPWKSCLKFSWLIEGDSVQTKLFVVFRILQKVGETAKRKHDNMSTTTFIWCFLKEVGNIFRFRSSKLSPILWLCSGSFMCFRSNVLSNRCVCHSFIFKSFKFHFGN